MRGDRPLSSEHLFNRARELSALLPAPTWSWRNGLLDFSMPFMIQTMREMQTKLDGLIDKDRKKEEAIAEEKKKQEEALASGYNGMDYGAGDPNSMVVYGQQPGMGGGYGMQGGYGY